MRNKQTPWRKIFGIDKEPFIDLTLAGVSLKAQEMVGKISISGVQPKLSVRLIDKGNKPCLEITGKGGQYILKPQVQAFANLPENEELCMTMAKDLGIDVPAHCLIRLKDKSLAYIIKRFDREERRKIHQEDFAQILGKENKYNGFVEEIGRKLKKEINLLADNLEIPKKVRFARFIGQKENFRKRLNESLLPNDLAKSFDKLLIERFHRLELA